MQVKQKWQPSSSSFISEMAFTLQQLRTKLRHRYVETSTDINSILLFTYNVYNK